VITFDRFTSAVGGGWAWCWLSFSSFAAFVVEIAIF
jgi:hypothetical protein